MTLWFDITRSSSVSRLIACIEFIIMLVRLVPHLTITFDLLAVFVCLLNSCLKAVCLVLFGCFSLLRESDQFGK